MVLFISPPFGNYLNLKKTLSIKGSFTLYPRPGKWTQILKTLRYSFKYGGWTNKIGLRNPGLDYALKYYRNNIISIAILEENEIDKILEKLPDDQDIELNVSCPNTEKHMISNNLHKFLHPERNWCIIKLSPLSKIDSVDKFYQDGFRQFHCCNTIPVKEGGLSGKKIIPYTCKLVKEIKDKYPDTEIIAGGGIGSLDTINLYKKYGADHFSVSSLLFNPIMFLMLYIRI